jgi:HlyD family secretion protein
MGAGGERTAETDGMTMTSAAPAGGATAGAQGPMGSAVTDAELMAEITKRRRPWGWLALALGVIAVVAVVLVRQRSAKPAGPRYVTVRVATGDVIERIEATGTVQPVLSVQVGAQVSGRVLRVHADFNQRVRAGELLVELDPEPFQTRINEARAAEASARAQLARARADLAIRERDLARSRELRSRSLNAQADYDTALGARDLARASVAVSQAEVARTQATMASARNQLAQSRIFAPIDGLVITRSIEPGQTVAASLQAPTLFVIAQDLTRMRVMADVDEADVGRMREGMTVEARVDAFPGERFRGTVTQLRFGPASSAGVVTYPAVIEVPNPELKLRPGMTANVSVTTARLEGALRVPNAALRFRPTASANGRAGRAGRLGADGGVREGNGGGVNGAAGESGRDEEAGAGVGRVFILRDGRPARVRVRVRSSDGTYTAVEAPELREGVEVVTDEIDESASGARGSAGGGSRPGGGMGGGGSRRMF